MDRILVKDIMQSPERILCESRTVRPTEKVDKDASLSINSMDLGPAQVSCTLSHSLLGWSLARPICNLGLQYWIVKLCVSLKSPLCQIKHG